MYNIVTKRPALNGKMSFVPRRNGTWYKVHILDVLLGADTWYAQLHTKKKVWKTWQERIEGIQYCILLRGIDVIILGPRLFKHTHRRMRKRMKQIDSWHASIWSISISHNSRVSRETEKQKQKLRRVHDSLYDSSSWFLTIWFASDRLAWIGIGKDAFLVRFS